MPVGDVHSEINKFFSNGPDEVSYRVGKDKRTPLSK